MLPDKNELNDETIEQINGGLGDGLSVIGDGNIEQINGGFGNRLSGIGGDDESPSSNLNNLYTCSNCGSMYSAITRRTDGFCPNCEPESIPKIAPVGDIKTTVPDITNKDRLVKIH